MLKRSDSYVQNTEGSAGAEPLHTVLIATDTLEAAESVAKHLKDIRFRVEITVYDGETLNATTNIDPSAILCYFSKEFDALSMICKALRTHYSRSNPPLIGAIKQGAGVDTKLFDSLIFPPAHHSQIASRVNSMVRLQEMEIEITHRVATLSDSFGIDTVFKHSLKGKEYKILFIGKASPEFMVIINALQDRNVEVIAAFTSFSAFDYLHEHTFDAVIMNALGSSEPALTIGETMRRNSRLYHVPTLFLVDEDMFTEHDMAFERGARDIISTKSSEAEIAGRILELANYHRTHAQLKAEFSDLDFDICIDRQSGAFNAAFFDAHLDRVCKFNQARATSVFSLILTLESQSEVNISQENIDKAYAQIGSILKNLVRMNDIVARLENDVYVITFAGLTEPLAESIQKRIMGIVECAAFDSGNAENKSFTLKMKSWIVELEKDEDSADFIQRTRDVIPTQRVIPVEKSA